MNCLFTSILLLTLFTFVYSERNCETPQDCTHTFLNISESQKYIQCFSNKCVCDGICFVANPDATNIKDTCHLNACHAYTIVGCVSLGKDWLTTLLLQIFVGVTGCANFYIGRYYIASAQLILFLIFATSPFFLFCIHRAAQNSITYEDSNNCRKFCRNLAIFASLFESTVLILCLFVVPIWWFADVVIIATNQRRDINGCFLNKNIHGDVYTQIWI